MNAAVPLFSNEDIFVCDACFATFGNIARIEEFDPSPLLPPCIGCGAATTHHVSGRPTIVHEVVGALIRRVRSGVAALRGDST